MACTPVCNCNFTMGNTGVGCTPLMHVTKRVWPMPYFDSTGAKNYIDLTATINNALFVAAINQADTSKRIFPLPEMKNVSDKRADPVTQKFGDDTMSFVHEGVRTFEGYIPGKNGNNVIKGKIDAARCGEVGVFLVDRLGDLIGIVSDDKTKLYPIRIDSDSLSATYGAATDTTNQGVTVRFNFHPDEQDACMGMIAITDMASDVKSLLAYAGLLDVHVTYSSITTLGAVAEMWTDFGTPKNRVRVKGLVVSDFISSVTATTSKVRDTVGAVDLTLSSATELTGTSAGKYTLVWTPAQTTGDTIVTLVTKTGYDFSELTTTPATVP